MKKILLILIVVLSSVACSNEKIDGEALYKTIDVVTAKEFVASSRAVLFDVRTYEEFEQGHIDEAINIPIDDIDKETIAKVIDSEISNIIVYCKSGARSKQAAKKIIELGYTNVYDLGAMSNWKLA